MVELTWTWLNTVGFLNQWLEQGGLLVLKLFWVSVLLVVQGSKTVAFIGNPLALSGRGRSSKRGDVRVYTLKVILHGIACTELPTVRTCRASTQAGQEWIDLTIYVRVPSCSDRFHTCSRLAHCVTTQRYASPCSASARWLWLLIADWWTVKCGFVVQKDRHVAHMTDKQRF